MGAIGAAGCEGLRERQIGSLLVSHEDSSRDDLPSKSEFLVKRIRRHRSKGSQSYYSKFVRNYLLGIRKTATKLASACNPRAEAWVVIQDSWYKDLQIRTDVLLEELFGEAGWSVRRKWSFKVPSSLSELAATTHGWRDKSPLEEHVLRFERT